MPAHLEKTIALFRAARLALHIACGLALAVIYPWFGSNIRRGILQSWSAGLLDIFNVRIDIASDDPLRALRHGLIVTNHISWLDVFVLNAVVPMRFVAAATTPQASITRSTSCTPLPPNTACSRTAACRWSR